MTSIQRRMFVCASAALLALATVSTMPTGAAAATPAKAFDFNGDGQADVAVGVPLWDVDDSENAGAVVVLPGGSRALSLNETVINQGSAGVPGAAQIGARFGEAIASADFNNDGYADLAVGAPQDHDGSFATHGSVTILFGTRSGLSGAGAQRIGGGDHALFGSALAAADFDKDGLVDLAVGATRTERVETPVFGSGAVIVLKGRAEGFSMAQSWTITRPQPGLADFGAVLAVGDVNGDGALDLVEGWEGDHEFVDDTPSRGHTTVALGGATGPRSAVVLGRSEASALTVGDVTGDGIDDVVVGTQVSGTFIEGEPPPPGRVTLYRGSAGGVAGVGIAINQASPGVPGAEETSRRYGSDHFGAAVALLDLDRDGRLDVLVGAPGEDRGAGRVTVVRGAASGFARTRNFAFDQSSPGVPGTHEGAVASTNAFVPGDQFGAALSTIDVAGSNRRDIVIGSPGENAGPGTDTGIGAGSVTMLRVAGSRWSGAQAVTLRMLGQRAGVGTVGSAGGFGSVLGRDRR